MHMKKNITIIVIVSIIGVYFSFFVSCDSDTFERGSWLDVNKTISEDLVYDFDKSEYKFIVRKTDWFVMREYGTHSKLYFDINNVHTRDLENLCAFSYSVENSDKKILISNSEVFTADGLLVVAGKKAIYYFDIANEKLIRKIILHSDYTNLATTNGRDLLFFDGGNLYAYTFKSDTAVLIHSANLCEFSILKSEVYPQFYEADDGYMNSGSFTVDYPNPKLTNQRVAYSKKYNCIYYKAVLPNSAKEAVFSMSLDTFELYVVYVCDSFRDSFTVNDYGDVFYSLGKSIYKHDANTRNSEKIFTHSKKIGGFLKVLGDDIFFNQVSKNIKGSVSYQFRVYSDGKVKYARINGLVHFDGLDFKYMDIIRRDKTEQ